MSIPQKVLNAKQEHDLTDRETEVLSLMLGGKSEKAIATRLKIAPGTVRTHVVHIYQKLGVRTRAELFANIYE